MKWIFWALAVFALVSTASAEKPAGTAALQNEFDLTEGVLICHHPAGLTFTTDTDFCAVQNIATCEEQNTQIPAGDVPFVWYIVSAFESTKQFNAVEYGINYNGTAYGGAQAGVCAPAAFLTIEYPAAGSWPQDGSAIAIALSTMPNWTGTFVPTSFLWGYHYSYQAPGEISLVPSPLTANIGWVSSAEGEPGVPFPAKCAGSIGFDMAGDQCCPQGIPTFACCLGDNSCVVLSTEECTEAGGTSMTEFPDCTTNPCPILWGCCVGQDCFMLTAEDCAELGGDFHLGEICINEGGTLNCISPADNPTWGDVKSQYR